MESSLVLPLQHLSCAKIVGSLLNKRIPSITSLHNDYVKSKYSCFKSSLPAMREISEEEYKTIKNQVTEDITQLIPCATLQKNLESFIAPLFGEIEQWLRACYRMWPINDNTFFYIIDSIPQCWLTDGTIDREKSAKLVVNNNCLLPTNRFIYACTYCLYEDIWNLWKQMCETEKSFVRHLRETANLHYDVYFIVNKWIEYLESWLNKDWPFCVAWILGTPLWNKNMCVLKKVLLELTPVERNRYLSKLLIGGEVSTDVMRFCLSIMARDEKILILKESPVEVFKCISSWPLRSVFSNLVDSLWPYLTTDTFKNILEIFLDQIIVCRKISQGVVWKRECRENMEMLQNFFAERPQRFKNILKHDGTFSTQLKFVLVYDFERDGFENKLCPHIFYEYVQKNLRASTIKHYRTINCPPLFQSRGGILELGLNYFRALLGLKQPEPLIESVLDGKTRFVCPYDCISYERENADFNTTVLYNSFA